MQTATSTCTVVASGTVCTLETVQKEIGGFTYGEVLIILLLIMIFSLSFFAELRVWLLNNRIDNFPKNKYNKEI